MNMSNLYKHSSSQYLASSPYIDLLMHFSYKGFELITKLSDLKMLATVGQKLIQFPMKYNYFSKDIQYLIYNILLRINFSVRIILLRLNQKNVFFR